MDARAGLFPHDHGPIYAETDLARFPVEPLSVLSNGLFLIIVLYWVWRLRGRWRQYPLLSLSVPILAVGLVGGTVYHATRSAEVWLIMDFLPIAVLALTACVYFWRALLGRWGTAGLAGVAPVVAFAILTRVSGLPESVSYSAGYSMLAGNILFPMILHCALYHRNAWPWLAASVASFLVAVFFRQADAWVGLHLFAAGSHWLWHLWGAASTFFLMQYLYAWEAAGGSAFCAPLTSSRPTR